MYLTLIIYNKTFIKPGRYSDNGILVIWQISCSNLDQTPTILIKGFMVFFKGMVPQLSHSLFTIYHSILYNLRY